MMIDKMLNQFNF